jgi:hypothetical protein
VTTKTFLGIVFPSEVSGGSTNPDVTAVKKNKRPTIPIRGPLEKLNVCFGYIPSSNPRRLRHAQRQHVLLQRMEVKLIVIEDEYTRTFSISLLM